MAKQRSRPTRRRDRKGGPGSGRRKSCPYCRDKVEFVDYKDIATLRKFISDRGKIRSRRITGACRRHQNQIATAVKRARELALLPYVGADSRDERGRATATATATATVGRDAPGHPAPGRRERRRARHGRRRLEGLPAQLPDPAQARRAGDARARSRPPSAARRPLDRAAAEATQRAEESAELLNKTVLTIAHQAGDDGRLFGSVTSQDIVDAIKEARGIDDRPPQGPPRGADQDGRHAHGHRRGRRRRPRQRQDHGGRAVSSFPRPARRRRRASRRPPREADPGSGPARRAPRSTPTGRSRSPTACARARAAAARSCSPARDDGEQLEPVAELDKDRFGARVAGAPGARPPRPGGWRLYVSVRDARARKHWWICALDAPSTRRRSPTPSRAPCSPATRRTGVKDPVIRRRDGGWHAWICCHPLDGRARRTA